MSEKSKAEKTGEKTYSKARLGQDVYYNKPTSDAQGVQSYLKCAAKVVHVCQDEAMRSVNGVNLIFWVANGDIKTLHQVHFSEEPKAGKWSYA